MEYRLVQRLINDLSVGKVQLHKLSGKKEAGGIIVLGKTPPAGFSSFSAVTTMM